MQQYVILEGGFRTMRGESVLEATSKHASGLSLAPRVRTDRLSDAEVRDAREDPSIAVAPVMETVLIKPLGGGEQTPAEDGIAWGVQAVGAAASRYRGRGCKVAVLDTGINSGHPAFAGVSLVQRDFTGGHDGDRAGHGSHCAGTIFGRDVGGRRIGVATGVADVLIGKVLGDDGRGSSDMIFRGIQWVIDEGADIASLSLGLDFPGRVAKLIANGWPPELATSNALEAYRENLRLFDRLMDLLRAQAPMRRTPLVIAATGNESRRKQGANFRIGASLPAAAVGVVSVGALARAANGRYELAPFSNIFPTVCALGVDILSADLATGLRSDSGTSMAAPHVAGVAALWFEKLSERGPVRPDDLAAALRAHANIDVLPPNAPSADYGVGMVTAP